MEPNKKKIPENPDAPDFEEKIGIARNPPLRVFWYLRYAGIFFIVISAFFLFQKSKPPVLVIFQKPVQNAPLGNILLSIGALLFGLYLANRIYRFFKT